MSHVQSEPLPAIFGAGQPHFLVGQDQDGQWLAVETHNLGGGLFKSRRDALHFADLETGHRPGAVEFATAPLKLRF